jgi:exopolyphosphatase/guanosine-5'-triphosphate,3'-diphosphate pyrophosphatase
MVAVIDIGSNSIKLLVASRSEGGGIATHLTQTIDARISAGIGQSKPRLSEDGMERGLAAIKELLEGATALAPEQTALVATSAVRDAANGTEFAERIRAGTGLGLRILSGDEEANLIGRGLTADLQLADLTDFYVFDLGGGSLECLRFRNRKIEQAISLPLGCVRLTERCVAFPEGPFGEPQRSQVAEACRAAFASSGFLFSLPPPAAAVFAGGTITTSRAILAGNPDEPLAETASNISIDALRTLFEQIAPQSLASRRQIPGLPAARADVFPAALATVLAIAEIGGFSSFLHSYHNLRYGLAAELLQFPPATR